MEELLGVPSRVPPIRQSTIKDTFCLRYYALRHRFGLVRPGYRPARENGSLFHAIVAPLYAGKSFEEAIEEGRKLKDKLLKELLSLDENLLEQTAASVTKGLEQDLAKAAAMVRCYWQRYGIEPGRFQVIAVELPLRLGLTSIGITTPAEMTVDLVIYDTVKHEVWIIDHKTVGGDPRHYQQTATYDPQTRMYRLGVTAWIRGGHSPIPLETNDVTGIMFNAIRRPTIVQKKKQTFEEYVSEIEDWYTATGIHEETTTGGANAMPEPYPHRFSEPLLPMEFHRLLQQMTLMSEADPMLGSFPRTPCIGNCTNRYGSPCTYREICASHPATWGTLVNRMFQVEPAKEPIDVGLPHETIRAA